MSKAEFELWLEGLTVSVRELQESLNQEPPDLTVINEKSEEMNVDLQNLVRMKPTTTKKLDYDYDSALSVIRAAKRLQPKVDRLLKVDNENNKVAVTAVSVPSTTRKIPELHINLFSGDITKYNEFTTSFHLKFDALDLKPEEKLQHLKSYLRDEPLRMIGNLELKSENYQIALNRLQKEYDNKTKVITELYHRIQTLKYAENNPAGLKRVFYELEGLLTALKAHGQEIDALPPLRDTILTKYPLTVVNQICSQAATIPSISEFQNLMSNHIQIRTNIQAAVDAAGIKFKNKFEKSQPPAPPTEKPKFTTSALASMKQSNDDRENKNTRENKRIPNCAFCNAKHYSNECLTVVNLSERLQAVTNRCNICLSIQHAAKDCEKTVQCSACKKKNVHHNSLCPQRFENDILKQKNHSSPANTVALAQISRNQPTLSSSSHTTVLVTLMNPDTNLQLQVRALLDNGANETYITEKVARRIGLPLSKFRTEPVYVFANEDPITLRSTSTHAYIILSNGEKVLLNMDTTPELPQAVQSYNLAEFKTAFPQIAHYNFADQGENEPVELLIGNDSFWNFIRPESLQRIDDNFSLVNTEFGWTIVQRSRAVQHDQSKQNQHKSIFFSAKPEKAIDRLCALDIIGIKESEMSDLRSEEMALKEFYANLKFINGRYQIRWPWREFPPPIETNFGLALGRLRSQQKKLNNALSNEYSAIIQEQIERKIIEDVPPESKKMELCHYIPHHPVLKPGKSTKLRIVYDGSARLAKKAFSINECIYKGRNLLTDLAGILIRFRLHRIVILTDIEKAFHQLLIEEQDRDFVRFLWVHDPEKPATGENLRILRFARVAFGIVASPFLLNAVIQYHLSRYKNSNLVEKLKRDRYVDNFCTGVPTIEAAKQLYQLASAIFADCSMNLRQWASNNETVRSTFDESKTEKSEKISVLGLTWYQYKDTINVHALTEPSQEIHTRRQILSITSQFFNPCGFFAPLTIRSKMLLQELRLDHDWDTPITSTHLNVWNELYDDLQNATQHEFQRFITDLDDVQNEYNLHIFTDASKRAYACCFYLQVTNTVTRKSFSSLVFAKTRIVKPGEHSIPKLEMFAIILATRSLQFVRDALTVPFRHSILWSDSKCVLSWIRSTRILPTFINRRITEIRKQTDLKFRHVSSEDNPADLPTRIMKYEKLQNLSLWWTGPDWMNSPASWPNEIFDLPIEIPDEFLTEVPTILLASKINVIHPLGVDPCRYNSYRKFIRVLGHIIRFCSRRSPSFKNRLPHTGSPFICAEKLWISIVQKQHYHDVLESIKKKKVNKHPLTHKFRLFLDSDNIIRCEHRLQHAPLTFDERCPILLPTTKQSPIVRLLIQHIHDSLFHAGTAHTLNTLRRRYWFPRGRQIVSSVVIHCYKCQRFTSRSYKQPSQSTLPKFRLQITATPFQAVGLDTFGPLYVENDQKRYVLIITDLVIRAIDLELLDDMTAEQLLHAYRRIAARRSIPTFHLSDNAPQFELLRESLVAHATTNEIQWKFTTEHAPWEGGAYESLIRPVKEALRRTFHGEMLTDTILRTALAEIAATMNSRPLTYVSEDSEDRPLTPNHFLMTNYDINDKSDTANTRPLTAGAAHLRHTWKNASNIIDKFWRIWKTSYLQSLRNHSTNYRFPKQVSGYEPQLNTVVLYDEKNIKRANWNIGRIIGLNESADGAIRSANLKTLKGKILTRPVSELYPLELMEEEIPTTTRNVVPPTSSQNNDDDNIQIVHEVEIDEEFNSQTSTPTSTSASTSQEDEVIEIQLDHDF